MADLLDERGEQALRLAKDWSAPLAAASAGPTGRGGVARPTEEAALDPDPLGRYYVLMVGELNGLFDNAKDLTRHLIELTEGVRLVNERMGIGWCARCDGYCKGGKSDRLRRVEGELLCPKCQMRMRRRRGVPA